jgi:hypothetical protein
MTQKHNNEIITRLTVEFMWNGSYMYKNCDNMINKMSTYINFNTIACDGCDLNT